MIKTKVSVVFTEQHPDGIEFIDTHWREISKIAHVKGLIKCVVVDEFQTLYLYDVIKPVDFRKHAEFVTLGMMKYQVLTFGNSALVNFQNGTA